MIRVLIPLACFAIASCAAAALVPTPKVTSCTERYGACVPVTPMAAYVACRAAVDRDCLDGGP